MLTLNADDVVAKYRCSAKAHIRNTRTDEIRAIDTFDGTEGDIHDVPFDLLQRDVEADFLARTRKVIASMPSIRAAFKQFAANRFMNYPSRTTRITWSDALGPDEVLELWDVVCEEDEFIEPPDALQCKTADLDPPAGAESPDAGGVGPIPGGTGPTPCQLGPELCDTP